MSYDESFWYTYTIENETRYNVRFASLIRDTAIRLQCKSILEIGCGTGIDLRLLPYTIRIYGADRHQAALNIAQTHMPQGDFVCSDIASLPFYDHTIDMIFTHKLLNYLDDSTLESGIYEIHRVSARYVLSCETYGYDGKQIRGSYRYRDIIKWWSKYDIDIMQNHILSSDIDVDNTRLLLIKIKH